jgi:3-hydroxyisobutyrate dehydrogenase-like beta-hydroxyacid dehydrogenase
MRVGVIGQGRMGLPMARNIAAGGHEVAVFDVLAAAMEQAAGFGARIAANPAELGAWAETILVSVPGPDEDDAALFGPNGVVATAQRGLLVLDSTTITASQTRAQHARFAEMGVDYIDTPVSGAAQGAVDGTLTVMAGGTPELFGRARPVLSCIGTQLHLIGPVGCGSTIKLLNQAIYVAYMTAFAEGLAAGEAAGIELGLMLDVLGSSAAGHAMMSGKYDDIRARQDRGFAIERGLLFMELAQDVLAHSGTAAPVLGATRALMQAAARDGFGHSDIIVGRDKYLARSE